MTETLAVTDEAGTVPDQATPSWHRLLKDPARLVFVIGTAGLLATGLVGLPLAVAGFFFPLIALPAILVVWVPLAVYGWRFTESTRQTSTPWSACAVLVVMSFASVAGLNSSQHLLTERDPGVYMVNCCTTPGCPRS
jgi:hypothetical protein